MWTLSAAETFHSFISRIVQRLK